MSTSTYPHARRAYADLGVDTEAAIARALSVPISLHCWQTDDVHGLEPLPPGQDGGGILATGGHPGRARSGDEMRADLDLVLKLLPGVQRVNLHASYAEDIAPGMDRDTYGPAQFERWIAWARRRKIALDFNPTYFGHPKAADGCSLSSPNIAVRKFWIRHAQACRLIAEHMGKSLGSPCVLNNWIPDGAKDAPADRWSPRKRLADAYDEVFSQKLDRPDLCIDAVEGKLFGIGSEEYVVGSQEFYSSYAQTRKLALCLDLGHYHPTESVADKVSALLPFHSKILLHTSRPVRWDSDHVVILDDAVRNVFLEVARGNAWDKVLVALDFFDASINRLGAYVIGTRATRQAILLGLLDPGAALKKAEASGSGHRRLALMEHAKALPWGAVWEELCARAEVPVGIEWLDVVDRYEKRVLQKRK